MQCCTGAGRDGNADVYDVVRGFQLSCKWRLVRKVSAKAESLVMITVGLYP